MRKNHKKIFAALLILATLAVTWSLALAQYQNQEKIPGAPPTTEFPQYLKDIINFGFATIGILALFMLVIGAYQYLMAAGNIGKVDSAKETIGSAIFGLLLGLCAWVILYKINPDLIEMDLSRISSLGLKTATGIIGDLGSYTPANPVENRALGAMKYIDKIENYAKANNIPVNIAFGLVAQESGGNPVARSPKNAQGLTQLMPGTAAGLGVTDTFNPDQNLQGGLKYLKQMYNETGSWDSALAAYNCGPGRYKNSGGKWDSLPRETRNFVPSVMGYANWYSKQRDSSAAKKIM